jgi:peptidoglycan hydrolase-like protein with peptidoglycan-binding domain
MKILIRFFLVVLFVSFSIPLFSSAQTATSSDVQAIIQQLQEQIKNLQVQIVSLQAELTSTKAKVSSIQEELRLTRILRKGVTGDDVKQLQEFLKQFPDVYPEGLVTGYFGSLTEAAVKKFQEQQGIVTEGDFSSTGFGQVGPKTIVKLNEIGVVASAPLISSEAILAVPAEPVGLTGTTTVPAIPATLAEQATTTSTEFLCARDSSYCATQKECTASGFFWYTISCHPNPSPLQSCAASYNYCSSTDCSANGWYWCRNSCYGFAEACLGQTYVPFTTPTSTSPSSPPPSTMTTTTTSTTETTVSTTTSNTTSATTDIESPSTPAYLTINDLSSTQIYLSWSDANDNVGVAGFKLYRNGSLLNLSHSSSLCWGSCYYTDTGLSAETSYSYTIAAYDAAGNLSPQSNSVSATTRSITTATTTTAGISGSCLLKNSDTHAPSFYAPDVGIGYAKLTKPGINDLEGMRSACTIADYDYLLQRFCTINTIISDSSGWKTYAYPEVLAYFADGSVQIEAQRCAGADAVCIGRISCPSALNSTRSNLASVLESISSILKNLLEALLQM